MYEKNPKRTLFFTAQVKISGKGGHSSVPYLTHNPISAAFRLIQIISGKVLYEFDSFQNVALYPVSFDAGTKQNIIPDDAFIIFKGESSDSDEKQKLEELLKNSLKAIEILYQIKTSVEFEEINER